VRVPSPGAAVSCQADNRMREPRAASGSANRLESPDRTAEILRLYQDEKLKMVEVARRLRLTEWHVWKTLHRIGAPLRPKGRCKGSWDARPLVWLDKARRLYEGGNSLVEVARAVGVSERKLRYHFQKAGIPCRKRGRPSGRAGRHSTWQQAAAS